MRENADGDVSVLCDALFLRLLDVWLQEVIHSLLYHPYRFAFRGTEFHVQFNHSLKCFGVVRHCTMQAFPCALRLLEKCIAHDACRRIDVEKLQRDICCLFRSNCC